MATTLLREEDPEVSVVTGVLLAEPGMRPAKAIPMGVVQPVVVPPLPASTDVLRSNSSWNAKIRSFATTARLLMRYDVVAILSREGARTAAAAAKPELATPNAFT